jgi:hypothetical protein
MKLKQIFIDEEDKEKLHELGEKILQAKKLTQEITEFFVTNDKTNYVDTEQLLSIVHLYIKGESPDYIGEQVLQDDGEPIKRLLKLMGIDEK